MEHQLLQRLEKLEAKYSRLRGITVCLVFLLALLLGVAAFTLPKAQEFDVITAKGIIIRDSLDRDRILIGAPIPYSAHRVRTDTALVRKHWAGNFPDEDQYLKWFSEYRHAADGIVVMNDQGFDRVLLGDKLADPNIGKRMFESAGVLWNDRHGWEKGGLGVNTTKDGKSRSIIGLDNEQGEAIHLAALEDGTTSLSIRGEQGRLMVGMSGKEASPWFNNQLYFTGLQYFNKEGKLTWEQPIKQNK